MAYKELNSLNKNFYVEVTDHLPLTLSLFSKWLKVDTSEKNINVTLPINLPVNFFVIVENIGTNRVVFQTETGATYKGISNSIEEQYAGVHLLYEGGSQKSWRSHGRQGRLRLDSLDNVFANENVLNQTPGNKRLTYVPDTGFVFLPDRPYTVPTTITADYLVHPDDHGKEFLVDTNAGQITISVVHTTGTGIIPGWAGKFKNIGTNNVFFDTLLGNTFVGNNANAHYLLPEKTIDLRYLDANNWAYFGELVNV